MTQELVLSESLEPPSNLSCFDCIKGILTSKKKSVESAERVPHVLFARRSAFYKYYFNEANAKVYNNWQWQLAHRITTLKQLRSFLHLSEDEAAVFTRSGHTLPFAVTPYYLSLIDPFNADNALRKSIIPRAQEFIIEDKYEAADPLGEDSHSPVPGLVHRYPDRVLFLVTQYCSAYCRYCTRSRMVCENPHERVNPKTWDMAIEYISNHPEVRDVLISGGDPLTLADDVLEHLIARIRKIPHVEVIRLGTKTPAVLPQRITPALCKILKKYHPIFMSVHFTHPDELTEETKIACERLADAGIPLGSQTVLLQGINDNVATMKSLMQGLLRIRVKPYYIFQCDPILGSSHFRTSVETGLEIIKGLRGHTSGYAVPHYVVDAPKGGGKIPLLPDYYQGRSDDFTVLKNYEGQTYYYPYLSNCEPTTEGAL